jgi:heavy metal sensor kinase
VRRLPISVRLGATFALCFVAVLVTLSSLAYWGLGRTLRAEIDRSLVAAVNTLVDDPEVTDIDDWVVGGVQSPEFDTQVMTVDGRVRSGSDDDFRRQPLLSTAQIDTVLDDGALFLDVVDDDGEAHRALAVPLVENRTEVLLAVAELESVQDAQAGLLRLAVLLAPLAGLLAGAAGWLVARGGLRPIARMTAEAEAISAQDPFPRLAVPPSEDEVGRLGRTLNRLLSRIEEGRRREREFTADASHELRTPLAVLRAELELARNHATDDAFRRSLDSALEECDRLGHLIDDLLLLARSDAGHVATTELVDVSEIVDELMPGFRRLAGRRGVTLARTGDAVVRADRRALSRALANLLDNAVRHTADGTAVRVTVGQEADGTAITVTDAGPGVPPKEREHMTQRFTQLDQGRAGGAAGLGLAIVASVAAAHGGRLDIDEGPDGRGLAVTLHLPSEVTASVST